MFERFTERARQVVVLSQREAKLLGHNFIGTEHLLLGLLREELGLGARALGSLGVRTDEVRTAVVQLVGQGYEAETGQIPFTPRAKKVLEGALKEAHQLERRYVGTEHLLLGLARLDEGVAARILLEVGADAEKIRDEVTRLLSDPEYANQAEADAPSTADRHAMIRRATPTHDIDQRIRSRTVGELLASLNDSDERTEVNAATESALRALTIGQLIDAVRYTKETYIENSDFEAASRFRDIEGTLVRAVAALPPHGA